METFYGAMMNEGAHKNSVVTKEYVDAKFEELKEWFIQNKVVKIKAPEEPISEEFKNMTTKELKCMLANRGYDKEGAMMKMEEFGIPRSVKKSSLAKLIEVLDAQDRDSSV